MWGPVMQSPLVTRARCSSDSPFMGCMHPLVVRLRLLWMFQYAGQALSPVSAKTSCDCQRCIAEQACLAAAFVGVLVSGASSLSLPHWAGIAMGSVMVLVLVVAACQVWRGSSVSRACWRQLRLPAGCGRVRAALGGHFLACELGRAGPQRNTWARQVIILPTQMVVGTGCHKCQVSQVKKEQEKQ